MTFIFEELLASFHKNISYLDAINEAVNKQQLIVNKQQQKAAFDAMNARKGLQRTQRRTRWPQSMHEAHEGD